MKPNLSMVPLDRVLPNPQQPRQHFAIERLQELVASIQQHGIIEPLVAWKDEQERLILIAGERRLRAAALAGLRQVPVLIRERPSEEEQLELALIENLQRAELDPLETARSYQSLIQNFGYTQEKVAEKVGLERSTVANSLRLLRLPAGAQDWLRQGKITAGHARALLAIEAPEQQQKLLERIVQEDLSVRAVERLSRPPRPKKQPPNYQRLSEELGRELRLNIRIQSQKAGAGMLCIHYRSTEELEELVHRLRSMEE